MEIIERARLYLSKMEPSISGSNGHNALFAAACALVQGFDLDDTTAVSLLASDFNSRCAPPWKERDLRHKVNQAKIHRGGKRAGYLLGSGINLSSGRSTARSVPAGTAEDHSRQQKRQEFDPNALKRMMMRGFNPSFSWLAERSPIDPREVGPGEFLDTIFRGGEATLVFFNFYSQGEFGHVAGSGTYRLGKRPGAPKTRVKNLPLSGREGAWFLPCPLDGKWHPNGAVDEHGNPVVSRRAGASIIEYRHLVLESDSAADSEWMNLLCQLPLPLSALYTSGGRSIHGLVKIDTASKSAFDAFRDRVSPLLSRLGADPAAMTGVRLTRLPGILREGVTDKDGRYHRYEKPRLQRLLYLNPDPQITPLINLPRLREIPPDPCLKSPLKSLQG